jgi:outer membrane immunogenic protein
MKLSIQRAAACATVALVGVAAAAGTASAQSYGAAEKTGLYIQGGYTYLDMKPEGSDSGADTNAITARLGYQFTPMFSIEGEVSSGLDDGEFDYNDDEDTVDLDGDGDLDGATAFGDIGLNYLFGAYARASLPVTDRLDIFAKGGWSYIDVDVNAEFPNGDQVTLGQDNDDGLTLGAGASFDITESIELRADYTWYDFDSVDTSAGTVTLGYKF